METQLRSVYYFDLGTCRTRSEDFGPCTRLAGTHATSRLQRGNKLSLASQSMENLATTCFPVGKIPKNLRAKLNSSSGSLNAV